MVDDEADRLLIARIRRGDDAAWTECINRFEGRLLAFVESRVRNRSASEDIVQETFLGFLVSLPNYDERTPLDSFLFAIAAHKLMDHLRREGRRPSLSLGNKTSSGSPTDPPARGRPVSSLVRSQERRGTEDRILREALQTLVREWIAQQQFERLKCVELLFVLGWSNKAVAAKLNLSEQTVANHKHFVVGKLQEWASRAGMAWPEGMIE